MRRPYLYELPYRPEARRRWVEALALLGAGVAVVAFAVWLAIAIIELLGRLW